jgi:hypothetical protein
MNPDKITAIFCPIDDFRKVFEPALNKNLLGDGLKRGNRKFKMSMSESTHG